MRICEGTNLCPNSSSHSKYTSLYYMRNTTCMSKSPSLNSRVIHAITESLSSYKQNQETYHTANELLLKTVMIIKTFNRPYCLLKQLVSMQKYSPYINILIADDSFNDLKINATFLKSNFPDYSGEIHVMNNFTEQLGTSKGRNTMINAAKNLGFEYIIMSDDDYEIADADLFVSMIQIYIKEHADIVATARDDVYYAIDKKTRVESRNFVKGHQRNSGTLVFEDGKTHMTIVPNITNVMAS